MALDARYMLAPSLQDYLVDKDTGAPLAAGVVRFFSDVNRTIPKPVYTLTGYPTYTYSVLPNPLTLSAVGTFQYNGSDILPYFYPYDENGNVELYYITVTSAGGVPQFVRQAFPNFIMTETGAQDLHNYIPNGQFLIHTDIPATDTSQAGEITQPVTVLGQGGWYFVRPVGSAATDFVTFERFGSPLSPSTANPRYGVRVNTQVPDTGDTYKDVRVRFNDVNKFASETQLYTLAFQAKSNSGGSQTMDVRTIKNYGTGGSAEVATAISSFTITATLAIYQVSFVFGVNDGKTISPLNDDYVEIAFDFPSGVSSNITMTDCILTDGQVVITGFPQTTNSTFIAESIAGFAPVPRYDGHDLYLPLVLTPTGVGYSHSSVGDVVASIRDTAPVGRLLANGSVYETAATSSDGIPYGRLQEVLWNDTLKIPKAGTGSTYLTAYLSYLTPATQLRISTNQAGAGGSVVNASDGAILTNFTINTRHSVGNYNVNGYVNGTNTVLVIATVAGTVTAPAAATSTFTITDVRNVATNYHVFQIQTVAAAGLAGLYFTFSTTTTNYYMWFTVNGLGANPSPGGTGIQLDLLSTYGANEVAAQIREAISGFQITTVVTTAASVMTAGCYFNINTASNSFYCWYKISGAGVDPAPTGKKGIEVDILTADTAAQVAAKTQIAINSKYYATPNYQGMILKGFDPNSLWDLDAASRWSAVSTLYGAQVGTFELDDFLSHSHVLNIRDDAGNASGSPTTLLARTTSGPQFMWVGNQTPDSRASLNSISYVGGAENRPTNAFVNYFIIY